MRVFSVLGNLAFGVGSSTFCVAGKKFTCELAHCHYVQLEPCDSSFIASHQIFETEEMGGAYPCAIGFFRFLVSAWTVLSIACFFPMPVVFSAPRCLEALGQLQKQAVRGWWRFQIHPMPATSPSHRELNGKLNGWCLARCCTCCICVPSPSMGDSSQHLDLPKYAVR